MSDRLGVEIVAVGFGSGRTVFNMAMDPGIGCLKAPNSCRAKSH